MSEWQIHRVGAIDSTNTALKRMALDGAPDGTVLMADSQYGGHGRMGRVFRSPHGGLYMSVLLRRPIREGVSPLWTVAAATAAAEACEALCGRPIGIKWVNDLFLDGRKVCGILAESVTDLATETMCTVVGFGVNITSPAGGFSADIADVAGALCKEAAPDARDRLAADILAGFAAYTADLSARTFLAGYRARSILDGRTVTFFEEGTPHTAQVCGVDDNGGLIVCEAGVHRVLTAGEVTTHREKEIL
ncbi:MAG: biotin--[acetyl-CoA-carboxylase] ligase [Ruminococcaceae bacterium]|nr:biotin--[acetyl-CoA-carboxylase] ligase [Oscillospiraceae bacterium]